MNVWTAASDGSIDKVKSYLDDGTDVNAQDPYGYTPLQAAVSYDHADLVTFLIERGADVKLGDHDMDTPLHRCESVACAKILLEHGAELNARNADGQTPYDVAIEDEHVDLIGMFESMGAEKSDRIPEEDEEMPGDTDMPEE